MKLADLSFDLAVQKCLAVEQANKDVQVLQGNEGSGIPVHKLDTAKSGQEQSPPKSPPLPFGGRDTKPPKPCYCCTGSHSSQKGPFIKERCYYCGIIGHTQQACKKKQPPRKRLRPAYTSWRAMIQMKVRVNTATFSMFLTVGIGGPFFLRSSLTRFYGVRYQFCRVSYE